MKKVLITGWNKWIWLATTKLFLEKWFRVLVLARDFSHFKLEDNNLEKIEFDLKNIDKIWELCKKICNYLKICKTRRNSKNFLFSVSRGTKIYKLNLHWCE